MLQLVKLSTELQIKNSVTGKKWIYHVTPPTAVLETADCLNVNHNGGVRIINTLGISMLPDSIQISSVNNLENNRIANLEREIHQLREIVNNSIVRRLSR